MTARAALERDARGRRKIMRRVTMQDVLNGKHPLRYDPLLNFSNSNSLSISLNFHCYCFTIPL